MRPILKKPLDLPEISIGQSPVVGIEHSQIENAVTLDAARVIHVTLGITQRQGARSREQWLATVQTGIAGTRNGSPACLRAINPDYVIEKIDRLESKNQRWITVLLES